MANAARVVVVGCNCLFGELEGTVAAASAAMGAGVAALEHWRLEMTSSLALETEQPALHANVHKTPGERMQTSRCGTGRELHCLRIANCGEASLAGNLLVCDEDLEA
jgi:hypothetical protein